MSYTVIDIGHDPMKLIEETTYSYSMVGVTINVVETIDPEGLTGYKTCVHTTQGGAMINAVQNKRQLSSGFNEDLNIHTSATVYFWREDKGYNKPLTVQFGHKYYRTDDGNTWYNLTVGTNELLTILDGQNCAINGAHILDISQGLTVQEDNVQGLTVFPETKGDGSRMSESHIPENGSKVPLESIPPYPNQRESLKSYKCPSCKAIDIAITFHPQDGYMHSFHSPVQGLISKVQENGTEQSGIRIPLGVTRVYLFNSPKYSDKHTLMNITSPENIWYKRESSVLWLPVEKTEEPIAYFDVHSIMSIIQRVSVSHSMASNKYKHIAILFGLLTAAMVVGFCVWEGYMMVKNPDKSIIMATIRPQALRPRL